MKSEKVDIPLLVSTIANEVGFSENIIYDILAECYGDVFSTKVTAIAMQGEGGYLLSTPEGKILNGLKLTHSKISKISDLFRIKLNELESVRNISYRFKLFKNTTHLIGLVKNFTPGYILFYIPSMTLYARVSELEFDILRAPLKIDDPVLLTMKSLNVNKRTGKVETDFSFKSKKNIEQILTHYIRTFDFKVCDFYNKKVKIKIPHRPSKEFIQEIQAKSNLKIQFAYKKAVA